MKLKSLLGIQAPTPNSINIHLSWRQVRNQPAMLGGAINFTEETQNLLVGKLVHTAR